MGEGENWTALVESLPCGVLCCGGETRDRILSANHGFLEMFGYTRSELSELCGDRLSALVCTEDRKTFQRGGDELEYRALRRDGQQLRVLDRNCAITGGGESRYCRILVDITGRTQVEEAARRAAQRREKTLLEQTRRDVLTGLYNKKAARAEAEASMAQWTPGTVQALMIIDLDDFKRINDCYGHLCGDAVLSALAGCLNKLLRATDSVARIGGDEFLAYLPNLPDRRAAEKKAEAILAALTHIPLREGGARGVSCSIGIAFYPDHGMDYPKLCRCADMALYRAKRRGKKGWAVYGDVC